MAANRMFIFITMAVIFFAISSAFPQWDPLEYNEDILYENKCESDHQCRDNEVCNGGKCDFACFGLFISQDINCFGLHHQCVCRSSQEYEESLETGYEPITDGEIPEMSQDAEAMRRALEVANEEVRSHLEEANEELARDLKKTYEELYAAFDVEDKNTKNIFDLFSSNNDYGFLEEPNEGEYKFRRYSTQEEADKALKTIQETAAEETEETEENYEEPEDIRTNDDPLAILLTGSREQARRAEEAEKQAAERKKEEQSWRGPTYEYSKNNNEINKE